MLEMSWITAILQLYSQVTDIFGNVILKRINMRVFDLLARFHYILNLPRICHLKQKATECKPYEDLYLEVKYFLRFLFSCGIFFLIFPEITYSTLNIFKRLRRRRRIH